MAMESSSMCEKTRMNFVVKNSRNLFFKTLLKNSPFDMEVLALKQVEKTSEINGKNQRENSLNIENSPKQPQFIGLKNIAVGVQLSRKLCCRSTARSTTNGRISDRWEKRSIENWAMTQRSTAQSTGTIYKEQKLSGGDRSVDRPLAVHVCAHRSTVAVDRQKARSNIFRDENLAFLPSIKSHKFS